MAYSIISAEQAAGDQDFGMSSLFALPFGSPLNIVAKHPDA
jgi:hypothetical protein